MPDRDGGLSDMLVRDLDQIELPPRGRWTTHAPNGVMS